MGTTRAVARPVPSEPQRSPERQALADAIAERDLQQKRVADAQAAVERVEQLVRAAETKLTQASGAAKSAREQRSERIAEAARSNTPLPSGSGSRAAIQHELECADELEAAKRAAQISRQTCEAVRQSLTEAEVGIAHAAEDVLRSLDANAMLAEMEATQHRLVALRLMHRFYRKNNLYPDKETEKRGERLCDWEFAPRSGGVEFQEFDRHPRFLDWQIARAALLKSADAPLPGQPGHEPLPLLTDPDAELAAANAQIDAAALSLVVARDAAEAAE